MHMTEFPTWAVWVELGGRVGWTVIAVATAFVMRRHGHDGGVWLVVGFVLGPLVVPAAVLSARRAARRPPIPVADGAPGRGSRDVLVVVSQQDPAAQVAWLQSSDDVRYVVLVAIVGRDTLDQAAREGDLRRARRALLTAVDGCAARGICPTAMIAEGRPDAAVASVALHRAPDAIVVPADDAGRALADSLRRRNRSARVLLADEVPDGVSAPRPVGPGATATTPRTDRDVA